MKRSTALVLAVLALLTASGCSEPEPSATSDPVSTTTVSIEGCTTDDLLECARQGSLADLVPDAPVAATGTPITIGMINQENTPAGSFPELSQATQTAVAWVNDQLGGIDGRPIEVEVCNTEFSAEGSTACAQRFVEAGVPVVLGGIDVFGNGIDTLRDNGIAYVGGIPVSDQSGRSANSFQFSGGIWGLTIAFADYAASTLDAKKVSILYGEFGSIAQSAELGEQVLEDAGVDVQMVPYPILATDLRSSLNAAAATDPDALLFLAADSGCKAGYEGVHALELRAQAFFVGACVAPAILDSVPTEYSDGTIVNVEGPVTSSQADPDTILYAKVVERYGDGLAMASAGTVTFRSFMNLYMVMRQLGFEGIDKAAILHAFETAEDAPSFMGHPYTCDGEQLEGLPALCSPQQILARVEDGVLHQIGTWIDVGAIVRD